MFTSAKPNELHDALDAAHDALSGYIKPVDLNDTRLLVLWAAHAHLLNGEAIEYSPRLIVDSTRYGSGKSSVLKWLDYLGPASRVQRQSTAMTEANLRRALMEDAVNNGHTRKTVWLLDEVDKWLKPGHEMSDRVAGLINDGFNWEGETTFITGEQNKHVTVSTFCAVAITGNSPRVLTDLRSRAVSVLMAPDPQAAQRRMSRANVMQNRALGQQIGQALAALADEIPEPGDVLDGINWPEARAADLWSPLLQVAALAGGTWQSWAIERAKRGAQDWADYAAEMSEMLPARLQLLKDAVAWIASEQHQGRLTDDNAHIPTDELMQALRNFNMATWGDGGFNLKYGSIGGYWQGLKIKSQQRMRSGERKRGYVVNDLLMAGIQYL
jgi:hypothetical protein